VVWLAVTWILVRVLYLLTVVVIVVAVGPYTFSVWAPPASFVPIITNTTKLSSAVDVNKINPVLSSINF
jgi:hypothetical protein